MAETSQSVIERGCVIVAQVVDSERLYWLRAYKRAVRRVYRCACALQAAKRDHQNDYWAGRELQIAHSRLAYCAHRLDQAMGWDRLEIRR